MTQEFEEQFNELVRKSKAYISYEGAEDVKVLVTDNYPDKAHFIYELLQNADDAGATKVCFDLQKDALVFSHNGTKQFDIKDVEGITKVSRSTKKDDYIKAGKFGIGFKSVYTFTDAPEIHCDTVDFKIEKMFFPLEIAPLAGRAVGETVFRLPFSGDEEMQNDSFCSIKKGLESVTQDTLLFLNSITCLMYNGAGLPAFTFTKTVEKSLVSVTASGMVSQYWKLFTRETQLHGKTARVNIAFAMKYDKGRMVFSRESGTVCMTFSAKSINSGLCFSINAPFGCTPSRNTININDEDNKFLLGELSLLVLDALDLLKEEDLIDGSLFTVLQTDEGTVPDEYTPLLASVRKTFAEKALLKAVDGGYVKASDALLVSQDSMKVITAFDARTLWRQESLCLVPYPQDPKAQGFLRSLGIKELSTETVLAKMLKLSVQTDNFIKWIGTIKVDSLIRLYAWLSREACQIRNTYNELENDYKASQWGLRSGATNDLLSARQKIKLLEAMPAVMCSSGSFCAAKAAIIMAINVPVPDGYQVVLKDILREDRAKSFLTACGVKQYGKDEYARDMKKMDRAKFIIWLDGVSKNYAMKGEESAIDVAIRVLDYAAREEDVGRVDFSQYAFVWASRLVSRKGIAGNYNNKSVVIIPSKSGYRSTWKSPKDCCIDEPFEATGFAAAETVHGLAVLDKVYDKMDKKRKAAWITFLKEHGMLYDVRLMHTSRDNGYSTGYDYDYTVPSLKDYLALRNKNLNLLIWKTLTGQGRWCNEFKFRRRRTNNRYKESVQDSTVLTLLRDSAWIPDKDGVMMKPCDISPDTIDKDFVLDWRNGFLEAIGLGANEKARVQAEKAKQENMQAFAKEAGFKDADEMGKAQDALRQKEKAQSLGIDIDQLIKQKEADISRQASHTGTIKEAINKKACSSDGADEDDDDYDDADDDAANAVPNANRRREKVAEQMKEAGPTATTGIYRRTVKDPTVRQFLKEQYSGKCQICSTKIKKRDGEPYFKAIAVFKQADLKREYNTGIGTAWNALCLCPNCAAQWKYSKVEMLDFMERVKEKTVQDGDGTMYKFSVRIQDEPRNVRYTPRHLIALQEALKYFKEV